MAEDDIDFPSVDDENPVKRMHDDLSDGLTEEIAKGVRILLERGGKPTTF